MTLQQRERIGSIIRSVVVIAIALICAVPWAETGSAEGAQILIRQGDALWTVAKN